MHGGNARTSWMSRLGRFVGCALFVCAVQAVRADDAVVDAAQANNVAAVLAAIEQGMPVTTTAADGTTALHWAVYNDNTTLVEQLIAAGADVDAVNRYGASVLSEAATVGNAAVIAKLLAAGADVDAPSSDGQTALMIVARSGRVDAARALLAGGANVNATEAWRGQTALMWAAAQRQPAMVRLLLESGAEVDARSTVNDWPRQVTAEPRRMYRPFGGLTSLMLAARDGCRECAQALITAGANVDLADPKNVTPLFLAIDNLHFDTAKLLIEAGANPNKWDWWGRTPLYSAVDVNTLPHGGRPDRASTDATTSLEIIGLLLEAGANPNVQLKLYPPWRHIGDDRGCDSMLTVGASPLLRAAKTFDVAAMALLIEHGALLELPNEGGITPLMAAAGYGSIECDARGYGPGIPHYLTADVEEKSIEALTLLLDAGAQSEARTRGSAAGARAAGRTTLFGAAFWGWNEVVKYLVARGATIDVGDRTGLTPVDAARGKAGGHSRGQTIEVFEDTALLLEQLCQADANCNLATPKKVS
jgi:ankyrin repeat protein